jgi:hypothetical protein
MAFGSSVSYLTQNAVGSYGYIVKINTAELLAERIEAVQAQDSSSDTPEPVEGNTSISALYAYLNDSACPDLAYNYSDGECSIFFKTSVFPYEATTRYALFGKRKAQNCTSDSDLLDCPDRDLNLLIAYCLDVAYQLKKNGTPKWIYDKIKIAERALRNE